MKILMTGMAARGVGSTKTRHKIVSLPDVLARALRELGHEVEGPRRVRVGEVTELVRAADVVLVQLGWVSSLSSTYGHEAGLAMGTAERYDVPVVRYVDDWRSQWLADDIAGHVLSARGWRNHTERFRAEVYRDVPAPVRDRIREALLAPIFGAPVVVPIMGWGDPSRFDVSTKARLSEVVPIDPQALCDQVPVTWTPDSERARRWVMASLQEHDRWVEAQGLGWEVLRMGANRKLPGGVPVRGATNQVVPEAEVLQRYAESWGVLSPEYASAGSGYWRTRFDQAMGAGCVIWPGRTDAEAIGGPLLEAIGGSIGMASPGQEARAVEALSGHALAELAAAQAAHLDGLKWPKERALSALEGIVRGGYADGYAGVW